MRERLVAVGFIGLFAVGCVYAQRGAPPPDEGLDLYKEGQTVSLCRDGYTAPTRQELEARLREGGPIENPPTGKTVRILDRDLVQPFGPYVQVARVEVAEADSTFWISYRALCSKPQGS